MTRSSRYRASVIHNQELPHPHLSPSTITEEQLKKAMRTELEIWWDTARLDLSAIGRSTPCPACMHRSADKGNEQDEELSCLSSGSMTVRNSAQETSSAVSFAVGGLSVFPEADIHIRDRSDETDALLPHYSTRCGRSAACDGPGICRHYLDFIKGDACELCSACIISLNALSIGLQVSLQSKGSNSDEYVYVSMLNRTFRIFFYTELFLRALCYSRDDFRSYRMSHSLSILAIVSMLVSDIVSLAAYIYVGSDFFASWSIKPEVLGVVRLTTIGHMCRALHSPTMLRLMYPMRVLAASIGDSLAYVLCGLLYLFFVNYVVAVLLTAPVADYIVRHLDVPDEHASDTLLTHFFPSVPTAALSLWEIALDGYASGVHWGQFLQSFYTNCPMWVPVLFLSYVSITRLGLLTIIAGICTLCAEKSAEKDCIFVMESLVSDFLAAADSDGDGLISWEEFSAVLEHPLIRDLCPCMANQPASARQIFRQVDEDDSGTVSSEEVFRLLACRFH